MPEYLTPGVYIEEVSYRSKSIEGVSTTTTGFIGPTRYGPIDLVPDVLTSLGDFEAVYGDRKQLYDPPMHNYMWHAARAFFEEGGQRLYVVRTFAGLNDESYPPETTDGLGLNTPNPAKTFDQKTNNWLYNDGHARATIPTNGGGGTQLNVRARFPGEAGKMTVRFTLRMGQNILAGDKNTLTPSSPPSSSPPSPSYTSRVGTLYPNDVVYVERKSTGGGQFYTVGQDATNNNAWTFTADSGSGSPPSGNPLNLSNLVFNPDKTLTDSVRLVTLTVTVSSNTSDALPLVWDGLPLDSQHTRNGVPDSWAALFAPQLASASDARRTPIVITTSSPNPGGVDGLGLLDLLDAQTSDDSSQYAHPYTLRDALVAFASNGMSTRGVSDDLARSVDIVLTGGNDGSRPHEDAYEGMAADNKPTKTGLKAFEDIDDISIIAAPGSTYNWDKGYLDDASTITNLLIAHAEYMRYRIAVLDCGDGQTISDVREMRGRIDSSYAALYYPWIRILDPVTRQEINLPPSGFVAGIYARNDINRGVYKAPANEVVTLALGFEKMINSSQQAVLNPEGINCFRYFVDRGFRLWGARTATSDPEWKYVNLRRYFAYLEHSLDKGTQWAVFEPNGEALWANVRRTVEDFLLNEWQSGALLGDKPDKAYFVRCDRTTMTQNDLDNGRLVCLVGVAPLRPAEFVIFRIGQWTGDSKS
ncbi:MAG: phage tail sheath subtilisin-like domain-containing protein [Ktedonobacteraceae bacterium]